MADILSNKSRKFYERTKAKFAVSLLLGAACCTLLGMASYSGGQARRYQVQIDETGNRIGDKDWDGLTNNTQVVGYGFATFCYVVGSFLLLIASLYASPLFCGTQNEHKNLKSPTEVFSDSVAQIGGNEDAIMKDKPVVDTVNPAAETPEFDENGDRIVREVSEV